CDGTRTVLLELYNSDSGTYNTVSEYVTADAHTASVKITFPKEKRRKTEGRCRITVSESETAKKAVKNVTVITKNIVTKELSSKAVCVYCIEDKKIIYEKSPCKRLKQASTTKLMTATLLLESKKKLSSKKKISKKAAKTPYSTPVMTAGEKYTNKALLYSMRLPSSHGAAVALAESVSGSTGKFVTKMNKKAGKLGMNDTHYANPHGLDAKGHYSSAYDLCLCISNIYPKSKTFRKVIKTQSVKVKASGKKAVKIYSKDMLLGNVKNHKGGKTGHTDEAGYCFCGVYKYGGKTYAVAILGSKSEKTRWSDMKKLYSYIDKYANTKY
ncbi:MAG: D-alanyl-D-alanine carboxypeptidase, partial [Clostridia bacterium]|nr:D-alanyl-D-alanine carboxypeptidase [Clostridia bacterium]